MSGTFNSPTGQFGYTPPSGLTSFGQTSGTPQIGSPLASPAERGAMEALLNIATGAGSSAQAGIGGPNPTGAPSTGSLAGDIQGARQSGMFGALTGMMTNPASLATTVPATMAAAAINALTGVPAKDLGSVFGLRGLATQLSHVPTAILNAVYGFPEKPSDYDASTLADSKDSPSPGGEAGYGDPGDNANSNSTAAGQDAAGNDGTGAGGAGTGAGAPGNDSGENYAGGGLIGLFGGGKIARGPGSGLDDLIPTTIDGARPAALSDGEFVIPADVVSMFGDGSSNGGAQRLYDLVKAVRQNKTGSTAQAGPLPIGDILKRSLR